ncbi:MAG: hypothetical protein Q4F05_11365 [bacterium]|nr:hypothetical protein [bacterium]
MDKYKTILYTLQTIIVISLIWYGLEWAIYGELKENIVDTIILMLFIPVIYKAVRSDFKKEE